jgi:hypothetical protein
MIRKEFFEQLMRGANAMQLPFDSDDVSGIETNCGTTWITLHNGDVYSISVIECEKPEDDAENFFLWQRPDNK